MKKLILFILGLVVTGLLMVSCKASLPSRFESFVKSIETNYLAFSEDDWGKANEQFKELFSEYMNNRSLYNIEEKKSINSAITRYTKIVAKSGLDEVISTMEEISHQIPSLIDEVKSFLQEIVVTEPNE